MLRTVGYLISGLSVILLGIVSWRAASQDPVLLDLLLAGMLASVAGMVLRWLAHRAEQRARRRTSATVVYLAAHRRATRS